MLAYAMLTGQTDKIPRNYYFILCIWITEIENSFVVVLCEAILIPRFGL